MNLKHSEHVIKADDGTFKGSTTPMVHLDTYEFKDLNTGKIKPKELFINYYDKEVYDYEHVRISTKVRNATVLFAILSLSLCTLFQKVSRFRKFLSNP